MPSTEKPFTSQSERPPRRSARRGRTSEAQARVSAIIQILMDRQGSKIRELAQYMGVDRSVISKSLTGSRSWHLDDLEAAAEFFEVHPAIWFVEPDTLNEILDG